MWSRATVHKRHCVSWITHLNCVTYSVLALDAATIASVRIVTTRVLTANAQADLLSLAHHHELDGHIARREGGVREGGQGGALCRPH